MQKTIECGGSNIPEITIIGKNIDTGEGHSSKGNQLKWEQDGWWYKADAFGYESLAEVVVSRLLAQSNIPDAVMYEPIFIRYQDRVYRGCRSRNFRREGEELVTLERIARSCTGFGLAKQMAHIADVRERIGYMEELVRNVTGIEDFGVYLTKMLEIDAFFLNEDRHTNNIALLYAPAEREYRLCPFFDMGLSLFSDTREAYPFGKDFAACRKTICAKPFSRDFDEQLDAANEQYGYYLKFDFPANRICDVTKELRSMYGMPECLGHVRGATEDFGNACGTPERLGNVCQEVAEGRIQTGYTEEEFARVEDVLRYQAGKYGYLF